MNLRLSSISSFDRRTELPMKAERSNGAPLSPATRLWILLCLLLTTMISIEYLARAMHDRRDATLTIEDGVRQALLIRHSLNSLQLLFAGNSLIFDDLSPPDLQQGMGTGFFIYTAGIPGSTYYDWQLGLHALFARGSQPDVLVFSISPSQFLRGRPPPHCQSRACGAPMRSSPILASSISTSLRSAS